jgi:hypothetical protein
MALKQRLREPSCRNCSGWNTWDMSRPGAVEVLRLKLFCRSGLAKQFPPNRPTLTVSSSEKQEIESYNLAFLSTC